MGDLLKDKVGIVTGSGRGIGRGVAMLMAAEGAKMVVNDLGGAVDGSGNSSSPADDVVDEIKAAGGDAVANYDSVSSMEGGENIVKTAIDNFGKLDIVVTPAGILRDRMVFNMTEQEWDDVIAVHLLYPVPAAAQREHHHVLVNVRAIWQLRAGELRCSQGRHRRLHTSYRPRYGSLRRSSELHLAGSQLSHDGHRPTVRARHPCLQRYFWRGASATKARTQTRA